MRRREFQASIDQDSGWREVAVFASGCFWSVEAILEATPGVVAVVSGFTGGRTSNPSYDNVVRGGLAIWKPCR